MKNETAIQVMVPEALHDKLLLLAGKRMMSKAALVREFISEGLSKRSNRELLKADTGNIGQLTAKAA